MVLDSLSMPIDFRSQGQGSEARGYLFKFLTSLHIYGMDAATKFKCYAQVCGSNINKWHILGVIEYNPP